MTGNPTFKLRWIRPDKLSDQQIDMAASISEACGCTSAQLLATLNSSASQIRLGHKGLLIGLEALYVFFCVLVTDSNVRHEYEAALKKTGKWKTSCKLTTGLIRFELGVDRRLASKYAKVILSALDQGIAASSFVQFVKGRGGVEAIARPARLKSLPQRKPIDENSSESSERNGEPPSNGGAQFLAFIQKKIAQARCEKHAISLRLELTIGRYGFILFGELPAKNSAKILAKKRHRRKRITDLINLLEIRV